MKQITYLAIFEPSSDGAFGVYFPDLPGCVTVGVNFEEARQMAIEALGLHLWGMEKDNESIPEPTSPPFIDVPEDAIVTPITIFPDIVKNEMDNRAVKTNITLPAWLKEMGEKSNVNFSQLLQNALKEYLGLQNKKI